MGISLLQGWAVTHGLAHQGWRCIENRYTKRGTKRSLGTRPNGILESFWHSLGYGTGTANLSTTVDEMQKVHLLELATCCKAAALLQSSCIAARQVHRCKTCNAAKTCLMLKNVRCSKYVQCCKNGCNAAVWRSSAAYCTGSGAAICMTGGCTGQGSCP